MHVNDKIIFLFVKLLGGQSEGSFRFTPSAFVTGVKRRRVEGRVFFVFLTPSPEMHADVLVNSFPELFPKRL